MIYCKRVFFWQSWHPDLCFVSSLKVRKHVLFFGQGTHTPKKKTTTNGVHETSAMLAWNFGSQWSNDNHCCSILLRCCITTALINHLPPQNESNLPIIFRCKLAVSFNKTIFPSNLSTWIAHLAHATWRSTTLAVTT